MGDVIDELTTAREERPAMSGNSGMLTAKETIPAAATRRLRFGVVRGGGVAAWCVPSMVEDFHLVRAARLNLLVVGPDVLVDDALRIVLDGSDQPVVATGRAERLALPVPAYSGTVILRDVDRLSLSDQHRLMGWLRETCGRVQAVATAARPFWPSVEAGTFLTDLYYRLNTIFVDLLAEKSA